MVVEGVDKPLVSRGFDEALEGRGFDEALEGRGFDEAIEGRGFDEALEGRVGKGGNDPIFPEFVGLLISLSLTNKTGIWVGIFVKYAGWRSDSSSCHAFLSIAKAMAFLLAGHFGHSGAACPFLPKNGAPQNGHFFDKHAEKLPSHLWPLERQPMHLFCIMPGGTLAAK